MLEYIDNKSKGKEVTIDVKYIESIYNKHFKHLKNAIDIVNQKKTEDSEDEKILMLAKVDKDKNKMPEADISKMEYETNMISRVTELIRPLYPEYNSDTISKETLNILAEDEDHQLDSHLVAQEVLKVLQGKPRTKKRASKKNKPLSKNICKYL